MVKMMEPVLEEFRDETERTKRVFERIPSDKVTWKPHEKSMALGQLALHIATVPGTFARILPLEGVDIPLANFNPPVPKNLQEIHSTFDESVRAAENMLNNLREKEALGPWRLAVNGKHVSSSSRMVVMRTVMLNHCYHHRGQPSVYLRLLNIPVPVIYGRSADENPFE